MPSQDTAIRFRQNAQGVWGFTAYTAAGKIVSQPLFPTKADARRIALGAIEDGGRALREIEAILAA